MVSADEYMAFLSRDKDRIEMQFVRPSEVATYVNTFTENISTSNTQNLIDTRGVVSGLGSGLAFNGTGDFVKFNSIASYNTGSVMTLEGWIKTANNAEDKALWWRRDGVNSSWSVTLHYGSPTLEVWQPAQQSYRANPGKNMLDDNWHHVAFVYTGTLTTEYIDGSNVGSTTAISGTIFAGSNPVVLGAQIEPSNILFLGSMDEFRYSNSARYTGPTITGWNRFNKFNDGSTLILAKMDESSNTIVKDSSSYSNNGIISGSGIRCPGYVYTTDYDTTSPWTNRLTTNPGSPFVDSGKTDMIKFLIGSTISPPGSILLGVGNTPYNSTDTNLKSQIFSYPIASGLTTGNNEGSLLTVIRSEEFYTSVPSVVYYTTSGIGISVGSKYVETTNDSRSSKFGSFTAEMWIMPVTQPPATHPYDLYINNSGTSSGFALWGEQIGTGRKVYYQLSINSGLTYQETDTLSSGAYKLSNDTWSHLAATFDGSVMALWINGTMVGSEQIAFGYLANVTMPTKFKIGYAGGLYQLIGSMDEFRLSNKHRYNTTFTPQTTEFTPDSNTIILYHFNEGTGSIAYDATGSYVGSFSLIPPQWGTGYTLSGNTFTGFNEIGVKGTNLFIRDVFNNFTFGQTGSELRIINKFRIGS